MPSDKPTIKDVARHAGVSFKTVSRVLNNQAGVRDELRARVRAAVDELGYIINYSAKALASGRSQTIGVVIGRLTDPHTLEIVQHVGEISERDKRGIVIFTRSSSANGFDMSNFIGHGVVGALLLVSPRSIEPYWPMIRALRIPTVVVEAPFLDEAQNLLEGPVSCVVSENRRGAYIGVNYLIELGHQRIAFLGGSDMPQNRLRLAGYRDALAAHGIPFDPSYVRPGRWTWESGYERALDLLRLEEPPTAIFCASDNIALGAMHALAERGVRVPEDMSLLGFDDIPTAAQSDPALSTVRQPTDEMVQKAMDLLVRAMRGEALKATNYVLPTTLIERDSCAPPRR